MRVYWKKLADRGVIGLNEIIQERYRELLEEMTDLEEAYTAKPTYHTGHRTIETLSQGLKCICNCARNSLPCVNPDGTAIVTEFKSFHRGQVVKARRQILGCLGGLEHSASYIVAERGDAGVIVSIALTGLITVSFYKSEAQVLVNHTDIEACP